MKLHRFLGLLLVLGLLCSLASGIAESSAVVPGPARDTASTTGYMQAQDLAKKMGVSLQNGIAFYTPADPQPMNAYMITHEDCQVGINKDGMYKVSEKGLVSSITKYLKEWMGEITEQSKGAIRFVSDPARADILISVKQTYSFYGTYRGSGRTSSGYSCKIQFDAYQLTDTANHAVLSATKTPGQRETTGGGAKFWKLPPELKDTDKLAAFVKEILGWYGFGAMTNGPKDAAFAVRRALIDRGLLSKNAGGAFDTRMKNAVEKLQAEYGLKQTGTVEEMTLIALYYDRATVDEAAKKYTSK